MTQLTDTFLLREQIHRAGMGLRWFEGRTEIVMPRVEGMSLRRLLRIGPPIDLARALDLVSKLLGALATAHDSGMVHADLQPACVVIDMRVEGDLVSIVDFGGKSDAAGPAATEYLAPEMIEGHPPSVASDIYAVGVILYQLLTGSLPFRGRSPVEVMQKQLRGIFDPVGIEERPDLERVCLQAMARAPSARFRDARSFAAALRAPAPVRAPARVH